MSWRGTEGQPPDRAPNLSDNVWLNGTGSAVDIERTILYGIRSGHGKAHNVAEMPAFGLSGMLTPGEIGDVVQYILSLNHRANLAQAPFRARRSLPKKAPAVIAMAPTDGATLLWFRAILPLINVWNNGGDTASLYRSIYYGLQRVCPAWYG